MTLDEFGLIWLSDPWIAAFAFVAIVGAVLWSHGWVATGAPPRPKTVVGRVRRDAIGGATLAHQAVKLGRPRGTRRVATADTRRPATVGTRRPAPAGTVVPFARRRARTAA